jgi:hypothetical protein
MIRARPHAGSARLDETPPGLHGLAGRNPLMRNRFAEFVHHAHRKTGFRKSRRTRDPPIPKARRRAGEAKSI